MDYIFDNDRPIYIQLVEKLRIEIISGKLKNEERIPSVRELALTTRVNPNTMQKALAELENEGLIYTERTNGKFVTLEKDNITNNKKAIFDEKIKTFVLDMESLGYDKETIINKIKEIK